MEKVIAIDGPSGSGKSSVARTLASRLSLIYIDTGAMFRALAYYADYKNVQFEEGDALKSFLSEIEVEYGAGPDKLIVIDGINLSTKIREHHVSKLASIISQLPSVRSFLLDFQRDLASKKVCVMEGRDIGTVVFPNAFAKFFVTASLEVRSQRRLDELRSSGNQDITLDQVIADQKKRDESDMNREVAPLKQADDAIFIDTSEKTIDQIVEELSLLAKNKAKELSFSL